MLHLLLYNSASATLEGYQPQLAQPKERLAFYFNFISPKYFQTLGTPVLRGREFTAQDAAGAPRVVIVNEATARRYWPGQEVIGKRLKLGNADQFAEVGGGGGNSKYKNLTEDPQPTIYAALAQNYAPDLTIHVRSATEPQALLAALRRETQSLDRRLPLYNLKTLAEQRDGSLYTERLAAALLTLFGLVALSLAAIGLYGVMSYGVTQRTREIGIRMALGAQGSDVLKLVIKQGLLLAIIGIALGLIAAFAFTRVMKSMLYEVSATDPLTFGVIALGLLTVALLACRIPARRATQVDPLIALRCE